MATVTIAQHANHEYPSTDAKNAITGGSDGYLYSRQLAYVVVKETRPTADDFGVDVIPVGGVWIKAPAATEPCDDFDRADGPIGPNYVAPPTIPFRNIAPMSIVDGHVEWPMDYPSDRIVSAARLVAPQPADQAIEITLTMTDNMWAQPELYCRLSTTDPVTCVGAYIMLLRDRRVGTEGDLVYANGFFNDEYDSDIPYWDEFDTVTQPPTSGFVPLTVTIRLEVDASGAIRFFYNGGLLMSGSVGSVPVPVPASPYVGFLVERDPYTDSAITDSKPWLEQVCTE